MRWMLLWHAFKCVKEDVHVKMMLLCAIITPSRRSSNDSQAVLVHVNTAITEIIVVSAIIAVCSSNETQVQAM